MLIVVPTMGLCLPAVRLRGATDERCRQEPLSSLVVRVELQIERHNTIECFPLSAYKQNSRLQKGAKSLLVLYSSLNWLLKTIRFHS
jgi:hypothetical protein